MPGGQETQQVQKTIENMLISHLGKQDEVGGAWWVAAIANANAVKAKAEALKAKAVAKAMAMVAKATAMIAMAETWRRR